MPGYIGIGTISAGAGGLTLDAGYIVARVANLLRRSDLDSEILHWIAFVQRDLARKIGIPGLRTTGADIPLVVGQIFHDLPTNFSRSDTVFYRNTTDAANIWGRSLEPLPRKFYRGDVVDLQKLLNVSVPSKGDPHSYWIEGQKIGVYPVLADGLTGVLQPTYYKKPTDVVLSTDSLSIPDEYRHDLIMLTYLWGLIALEKDDITKIAYWKKEYKHALNDLKKETRAAETPRESTASIPVDMSSADDLY